MKEGANELTLQKWVRYEPSSITTLIEIERWPALGGPPLLAPTKLGYGGVSLFTNTVASTCTRGLTTLAICAGQRVELSFARVACTL